MPLFKLTGLAGKFPGAVFPPDRLLWVNRFLGPQFTSIDFELLALSVCRRSAADGEDLEFQPAYPAEDAVREFAALRKQKAAAPAMTPQEAEEDRLRAIIERRKNIRQQMTSAAPIRPRPRGHPEADVVAESADSSPV